MCVVFVVFVVSLCLVVCVVCVCLMCLCVLFVFRHAHSVLVLLFVCCVLPHALCFVVALCNSVCLLYV